MLGNIRADRLPPLEGDQSGWRLGVQGPLSIIDGKVKSMAKDIAKLWTTIALEYPDTPWALLAQRESQFALGLHWKAARD